MADQTVQRIPSVFGDYAKQLQVLVDKRLDKFQTPFWQNYFTMGMPKVELTYATAVGRSRIEAAASVVAHGAEAPLRGRMGLEKYDGSVASIKVKRKLDEMDYRNYLVVQALRTNNPQNILQILQLIWGDVKYVGDAITSRVDIMSAQALSEGKVYLNSTYNPDGIVEGTIDLLVPSANKQNVAVDWVTSATATPITDLRRIVRAGKKKGFSFDRALIHIEKMWDFFKCTEVINALKGWKLIEAGTIEPTLDMVNMYMKSQGLPVFEVIDLVRGVEKNGNITTVEPWKKSNVTLVPAGMQGVIHNSYAIEDLVPVQGVTYAKVNNSLISKWSQTEPFGEFTRGELAAFPGLETADAIYIIDTTSTL